MRFVTFQTVQGTDRLGFVASNGQIADLEGSFAGKLSVDIPWERACELAAALAPSDPIAFLVGGDVCLEAARQASSFVKGKIDAGTLPLGPSHEKILFESGEVCLKAPLPRPRKIICAGKNFVDHLKEMSLRGGNLPAMPVAFPKVPSAVIGPDQGIDYPEETSQLDYEVEMAIVIGKQCWNISREQAFDHVFGYTVFNDISARDVSVAENREGVFLLGKNLPGFAPMGPYLCTRDEIGDPQSLHIECRVNGEVRQSSNLAMMMFKIDQMIAFWSRAGLEPGDVLTTGTPSGVAAGRREGAPPWWLKKGDVVEAEVENLGVLRTYIK